MSDEQKLKPCPFCGSVTAPIPVRIAPTMVTVRCKPNMGGCDSESGVATTEYEAIAAWNKRADQSITGRADFGEPAVKHHERRELVNELTKIAREYGQTQQLRERIAHALPFDK